jgi:hypothetical protein
MRSFENIVNSIKLVFMTNTHLSSLYGFSIDNNFDDYFSALSIENITINIIAFAIYTHEQLWGVFKKEVADEIANSRVHTREWYRQKALAFMLGVPIIPGSDKFDLAGLSDQAIEAAKVIKQAATVKLISTAGYGILRIKVATKTGNNLAPVPLASFNAFKHYMNRHVVDAGTQIVMTTGTGDDVRFTLDIYIDPLILTPQGQFVNEADALNIPSLSAVDEVDNTETIIHTSIRSFLQSIEFNGRLILSDLEKHLRLLPGVEIAVIKSAASKYGQYLYSTNGVPNVGVIDEIRIADSGWFKLDVNNTNVNFKLADE